MYTLTTVSLLICHNLQIDENSLPGVCLSRWRTLIIRLNYLLPAKRDSEIISSLRTAKDVRSQRDLKIIPSIRTV